MNDPHRSKTRELSDIPPRARKLAAEAIGIDSHIDTVRRTLDLAADEIAALVRGFVPAIR